MLIAKKREIFLGSFNVNKNGKSARSRNAKIMVMRNINI